MLIPSQLYVGLGRVVDSTAGIRLGFAVPDGTDAAAIKRKSSVDYWCRRQYEYDKASDPIDPVIIENKEVVGFTISTSVRRVGWNGGNVVWRVYDPRGFELEISSENFARIVDCATIINGAIDTACVWGRDGSRNVLLPVTSEPYKSAVIQTQLTDESVNFNKKDMDVGDLVQFKDASEWIYVGQYTIICAVARKVLSSSELDQYEPLTQESLRAYPGIGYLTTPVRYVFGQLVNGTTWQYTACSRPTNVAKIIKKHVMTVSADHIAKTISNYLSSYDTRKLFTVSTLGYEIGVEPGKVLPTDLRLCTIVRDDLVNDNRFYVLCRSDKGSNKFVHLSVNRDTSIVDVISVDEQSNTWLTERCSKRLSGYNQYEQYKQYNLVVKYKNNKHRIY